MPGNDNAESTVTEAPSKRIESALARFEEACRQDGSPDLAAYLPADAAIRRAALIALARADLEHRYRVGQPARVEDYLQRFPELADADAVRQLVAAECRVRRFRNPVSMTEYEERFPQLKDDLAGCLDTTLLTLPSALPPPAALPGENDVEGRYRIVEAHARGGLGQVFIALDKELHRQVALKEIQAEHAGDPFNRNRFLLEAEITGTRGDSF
ncbi:MAG: hypothetical protein FJ271_31090 [Planctomycetes bacterium]|nr:hypothetical protein [Planctomycetota bacterium]